MSRSPLSYPLNRGADAEAGGAAELQTDVMRFMAILALCLMAIFALVQSIPLAPDPALPEPVVERPAAIAATTGPEPQATPATLPEPSPSPPADSLPDVPKDVVLTRPVTTVSRTLQARSPVQAQSPADNSPPAVTKEPAAPADGEADGFTLRFASDAALMRAVAAHHVGVYAIEPGRARRMTVSESRISFWDASTPNSFHEMEPDTVPASVAAALARAGAPSPDVRWGVTLPGRMKARLKTLMEQHDGGFLVIQANGDIYREASQ